MKGNIMSKQTINRKEAVTMRKFGFTYKQISEALGCSQQWCATNLANIKVNDFYIQSAYEQFKKETDRECSVCGMKFVTNEDSDYFFDHVQDNLSENEFCSSRCHGHYLLDVGTLKDVLSKDYKKM